MRKNKYKYHITNGIVQVLKIRKKVWIALRLHLDNNFNLLAGTWRQETRHQSTPPPHSRWKKKRIRKTDWEICLITLPCEKTLSFRSLLTAAPSRSRIFKRLLANASAVTDDKQNVFAYAATDNKDADRSPTSPSEWLYKETPKKRQGRFSPI
jgi:hypothetical protein